MEGTYTKKYIVNFEKDDERFSRVYIYETLYEAIARYNSLKDSLLSMDYSVSDIPIRKRNSKKGHLYSCEAVDPSDSVNLCLMEKVIFEEV